MPWEIFTDEPTVRVVFTKPIRETVTRARYFFPETYLNTDDEAFIATIGDIIITRLSTEFKTIESQLTFYRFKLHPTNIFNQNFPLVSNASLSVAGVFISLTDDIKCVHYEFQGEKYTDLKNVTSKDILLYKINDLIKVII